MIKFEQALEALERGERVKALCMGEGQWVEQVEGRNIRTFESGDNCTFIASTTEKLATWVEYVKPKLGKWGEAI